MIKDNLIFLHFIEQQFNNHKQIHLLNESHMNSSKEAGFYFHGQDDTVIEIMGTCNNTLFSFYKDYKSKYGSIERREISSYEMPYADAQQFLQSIYLFYYREKITDYYPHYSNKGDYIDEQIKVIQHYLSHAVIADTRIDDNFILNIDSTYKGEHLTHKLRLGKLLTGDHEPKSIYFTGVIGVFLTLDVPKDTTLIDFPYDQKHHYIRLYLPMPGWEVSKYPCMKNFVHVKDRTNGINDFYHHLKESSLHLATTLHASQLEINLINHQEERGQTKLKI